MKNIVAIIVSIVIGLAGFMSTAVAATRTHQPSLVCPKALSSKTVLPAGAHVVGNMTVKSLPMWTAGLALGKVSGIKGRDFAEEILDEWESLPNGSEQTIAQYDANHSDLMLKCTYAASRAQSSDQNSKSTIVFIPLPTQAVSCKIIKKNDRPVLASCAVP